MKGEKKEEGSQAARQRAEVIMKVRCGLLTATQAAQLLQVSRKTYYKWEQRGLSALLEGVKGKDGGRPETAAEHTQKAAFDKELRELQQKNELLEKQLKLKDLVYQMRLKAEQEGAKKNERIREVIAAMESISSTHHIPVVALVGQMALSYDSLMRWKRRIRRGEDPVRTPGPKKVEPLDLKSLKADIQLLKHARKRTHATGALYQQYRAQVSRRQLNAMVMEARREYHRQEADRMQHIEWHHPDLAWAIDGSEPDTAHNLTVYRIQDLASRYKFPPVAGSDLPCGEEVSGHLERLFRTFAVPLFLKRDNESILNHHALNETLEQHLVIPLNSPTYYAPYNGAIEHTQGKLNRYLKDWSWKAQSPEGLTLLAELGNHDHNHLPRRSLKGKNSCRAYFDGTRVSFDKRTRKEVFLWIKQVACDMLEKLGDNGMFMTAWRIAARTWLHQNHYITIVRHGKVLPYYS